MRLIIFFVLSSILLSSCRNGNPDKGADSTDTLQSVVDENLMISQHLIHYWDDFDFGNMSLIRSPQVGEQKFVNFLAELTSVPDSVADQAITAHLSKAEVSKTAFDYYAKQYEHYLYDPNSPMRNEVYYKSVLSYQANSPSTDETTKVRLGMILKLVDQNMPGSVARDFSFEDVKGNSRQLHGVASEYKVLFFYDPTCETCAGKIKDLENSKFSNELIAENRLSVLAISLHPDRDLWKQDWDAIPTNWINGYNIGSEVINKGLYNVLAYPTVYLLDSENKVLLKDAPLDVTLRRLFHLTGKG